MIKSSIKNILKGQPSVMCIYIQKQSNNYVSVYIFNIFVISLENSDGNHTEVLFIE